MVLLRCHLCSYCIRSHVLSFLALCRPCSPCIMLCMLHGAQLRAPAVIVQYMRRVPHAAPVRARRKSWPPTITSPKTCRCHRSAWTSSSASLSRHRRGASRCCRSSGTPGSCATCPSSWRYRPRGTTETNRIHLALFGMQNRTLRPYSAANTRILISPVGGQGPGPCMP
jgi:hypothetical protein